MNQTPTDDQPLDAGECAQKVYPTSRVRPNKRHLAYWSEAIFQRRANGNWWMILQHAGIRRKFSLETPVKAAAAARARDTYLEILSGGWEAALATLHGHGRSSRSPATVGRFLEELEAKADLKPET